MRYLKLHLILCAATIFFLIATNAYCENSNVEYKPGDSIFQKAWNQFYKGDHEPELDDPLINAGKKMTLVICEAIMHEDMKFRRYAIGALGFIGDVKAIPTLEVILKNEKEKDYFRGDALHSIYQINESLGRKYADEYKHRQDYLRLISEAILKKESWLTEPTEE
jgi:hypothetical protein